MLRDFVYAPDTAQLAQILGKFEIPALTTKNGFALIEFQTLTPDSFIWRLLIHQTVYYLYAEDFVDGLASVEYNIRSYAVKGATFEFVKVKDRQKFDDASPVKSAALYKEPTDSNDMMAFAASSGYDFVFLCTSDEDANDALFNSYPA